MFFKRCKLVLYFHPQRRISPIPFPERKWWSWSEQTDLQGKVAICSGCWNCATRGLWTVDLSTALELRNLVERVKACCLISIKEACSYVNIKYVNTKVHECTYIFVLLYDITCHVYMYVMMLHFSFEHFFFSHITQTSNDFHIVMSVMSQTCKLPKVRWNV